MGPRSHRGYPSLIPAQPFVLEPVKNQAAINIFSGAFQSCPHSIPYPPLSHLIKGLWFKLRTWWHKRRTFCYHCIAMTVDADVATHSIQLFCWLIWILRWLVQGIVILSLWSVFPSSRNFSVSSGVLRPLLPRRGSRNSSKHGSIAFWKDATSSSIFNFLNFIWISGDNSGLVSTDSTLYFAIMSLMKVWACR